MVAKVQEKSWKIKVKIRKYGLSIVICTGVNIKDIKRANNVFIVFNLTVQIKPDRFIVTEDV